MGIKTLTTKPLMMLLLALALGQSVLAQSEQEQWQMLGPFGGNARSLAYDPSNPDHILLGSGAGAVFSSADGGRHWTSFALGAGHDLMVKSIVFDPKRTGSIYVAGWSITGSGGGFFVSRDRGRSWTEPSALQGKSIQALALTDSVPGMMVAGALDGLYRSLDWGDSWQRITPEGHSDLKNFESVAIDPQDPKIIYAGTWHLPWKTSDGGLHWNSIKQGVIDDSDVFSIILDPARPQTMYASACSGIYKSDNGGELFRKVQGMPGSARRTRVLQQDPNDASTVYAGTTEGLWKTTDGGKAFQLVSAANYILNAVLVDPRNSQRVLIATDRGGVFASDDGGLSFYASNEGFSQRQITALVAGPGANELYASVVNDREFGGVFRRQDGRWVQMSEGLGSGDVFDLRLSAEGRLVAATQHGLYLFEPSIQRWTPSRTLLRLQNAATTRNRPGRNIHQSAAMKQIRNSTFAGRAMALAMSGHRWFAATAAGVLISDNQGGTWSGGALNGEKEFYSISAHGRTVVAATLREVWRSDDNGAHWLRQPMPEWVSRVYSVTVAGDGGEWAATREGALRWRPNSGGGGDWEHVLNGLPARDVISIRATGEWLLAGAGQDAVYVSHDQGKSWISEKASGFELTGGVMQGENLYLISRQHGVLVRERP
jgi:hypothetical protein